jgi:hypothetical protein
VLSTPGQEPTGPRENRNIPRAGEQVVQPRDDTQNLRGLVVVEQQHRHRLAKRRRVFRDQGRVVLPLADIEQGAPRPTDAAFDGPGPA